LFAPTDRRDALLALYAFNYEIARVREVVHEPMLGQIRLQWWRENIAGAYEDLEPRRHPVVEALAAAVRTHGLTRGHFDRLIDTREADFAPDPPPTLDALETYAEGSAAALCYLALEVLDAATPAAIETARHVAIAYALTGLLRAMPFHVRTGRDYRPGEFAELDRPGAVSRIAARASHHLDLARQQYRAGGVPWAAFPALLPAVIAARALERLRAAKFDVFAPGIAVREPLQAWRLQAAKLRRRF
jgi:NADH dehydrogenase [ubiquinone] 1 alpha subcomplex assembly factor 6